MSEQETHKGTVADILGEAIAAVNEADVPDDLKQAAFSKAVDVIMARRTAETAAPMGTAAAAPAAAAAPTVDRAVPTAGAIVGSIAARLRLNPEVVGEVYDETDGKLDVIVPPRKLAAGKATATKQLALLVVAARQAAEIEEWTDADEIRRFVEDFKRYDQANFAATLKDMDDIFRVKQSGRKISLKLSRPGWDRAVELITKLSGEE
jgi:hypothetical protein